MIIWRLTHQKHLATATSGEGSRLWGGRWNSPGTAVVYASSHLSLAMLESIVNLDDLSLLAHFRCIPIELEPDLVRQLPERDLPAGWDATTEPEGTKKLGDAFVQSRESVALAVPSAVVPVELNILINPGHADFGKLKIGEPRPVPSDKRLLGLGRGGKTLKLRHPAG